MDPWQNVLQLLITLFNRLDRIEQKLDQQHAPPPVTVINQYGRFDMSEEEDEGEEWKKQCNPWN